MSELFRIDSGVRQGCIMSPWPFNVYMDAVIEVKMGMGRKGKRFMEEGREWRLLDLLSEDDLVLRGLKFSAGKSKVMVHLEHVTKFKYLGCVLDESGTDGAECSRKGVNGRRVADAIKSLVNARDLQIECASLA